MQENAKVCEGPDHAYFSEGNRCQLIFGSGAVILKTAVLLLWLIAMTYFLCTQSKYCFALLRREKICLWHEKVKISGRYNYQLANIPVHMNLNIDSWKKHLEDFADQEVVKFLEFGWPLGFEGRRDVVVQSDNHGSALSFQQDVCKYVKKEVQYGSLVGPYITNPLTSGIQVSPMSTVDKDGDSRRIIVDLSFPAGCSINDGIPKDTYLGRPSVDTFRSMVFSLGNGCLMYKRDLSRAYRQFAVDPYDYNVLGIEWHNSLYIDTALPMGLRSAAQACQRITSAITSIVKKNGFLLLNYLDDFAGLLGLRKEVRLWRHTYF